jgi:hypothetical protein
VTTLAYEGNRLRRSRWGCRAPCAARVGSRRLGRSSHERTSCVPVSTAAVPVARDQRPIIGEVSFSRPGGVRVSATEKMKHCHSRVCVLGFIAIAAITFVSFVASVARQVTALKTTRTCYGTVYYSYRFSQDGGLVMEDAISTQDPNCTGIWYNCSQTPVGLDVDLRFGVGIALDGITIPRGEWISAVNQLEHLVYLNLANSAVQDDDLKCLRSMKHLMSLDLTATPIGDRTLVHISNARNLRELRLQWTAVSDRGVAQLAKLENLQVLSLRATKIGDAAIQHLRSLKSLRELEVSNTRVSHEGARALARDMPNTSVYWGGALVQIPRAEKMGTKKG